MPRCLDPAQQEYRAFFDALDDAEPDDARYRAAVREAPVDLDRRVDFPLGCPDAKAPGGR